MVNYNSGKIYKIEPTVEHEEGKIYFGSTTKALLSQRISSHKGEYKQWQQGKKRFITILLLFDKYGLKNCNIILIKNVCANSKDELHAREAHYIKTLNCMNKKIPTRTIKEWDADTKYHEIYRSVPRKEASKYYKIYYERNKDVVSEKHKIYVSKNKESISKKRKETTTCLCGSTYTYCHKARHERSNKHQTFLENNPECIEL